MSDEVTQVTATGWGSRIGQSFMGALFGLALFVAAFPLEFWNEGRAVAQHQALQEGASSVVDVAAVPLDKANEGKLVHVSGTATALQAPVDADFNVQTKGLLLERKVEMFQWKEDEESRTEKKLGGGERKITTYRYSTAWSDKSLDSARFHEREGHVNPDKLPFPSRRFAAPEVRLGDFVLGEAITGQLSGEQPVTPDVSKLPPNLAASFQAKGDTLYTGKSTESPKVGDVRVRFEIVPEQPVSVIGAQTAATLAAYPTKAGNSLLLVDSGTHAAADMFKAAEASNSRLTWILRAVGLAMMWIGLRMAFGWLSTILDVLPFLGSIAEFGIGLVAALVAIVLSLITVSIAWFVYRPLVSVTLIAAAVVFIFVLRRRKTAVAAASTAMPPPPPPPRGPPLR
jgi:Transmembrane protein 43